MRFGWTLWVTFAFASVFSGLLPFEQRAARVQLAGGRGTVYGERSWSPVRVWCPVSIRPPRL